MLKIEKNFFIVDGEEIEKKKKDLQNQTFHQGKGEAFFKALGHPLIQEKRKALRHKIKKHQCVGLYDVSGFGEDLCALLDLGPSDIHHVFVQSMTKVGSTVGGIPAEAISSLKDTSVDFLLIADFDPGRLGHQIHSFIPKGCIVEDLNTLKLEESFLTNPQRYLDPINFATNFSFFQEAEGVHTTIVTANYWHRYGGKEVRLFCLLFDQMGQEIVRWTHSLEPCEHLIILDSREIRQRFGLQEVTGQLFLHVLGARGHDIVKYALDITSDDGMVFGSTHDANAWPSIYFAGLPAPQEERGEDILLWLQNSHPVTIPSNTIHLQRMGEDSQGVTIPQEVPPFGSVAISLKKYLPEARWPGQLGIRGGNYFVRPRYGIVRGDRRTIAHVNVERDLLAPDPHWHKVAPAFGKGYLVPSPLLPLGRFDQELLPTPMSRLQKNLPLKVLAYDAEGKQIAEYSLGKLPRHHETVFSINRWLQGKIDPKAQGHLETIYDLEAGSEVDGCLHAIFRFHDLETHHVAETSFGSHLFNDLMTYKNEPFSYNHIPPGLSTRLFLRVATSPIRTFCHLSYPVSRRWHPMSRTQLCLMSYRGELLETVPLEIPENGSHLFWVDETFKKIPPSDPFFVLIRDETCRLFGYHGREFIGKSFSLDHMFGF